MNCRKNMIRVVLKLIKLKFVKVNRVKMEDYANQMQVNHIIVIVLTVMQVRIANIIIYLVLRF